MQLDDCYATRTWIDWCPLYYVISFETSVCCDERLWRRSKVKCFHVGIILSPHAHGRQWQPYAAYWFKQVTQSDIPPQTCFCGWLCSRQLNVVISERPHALEPERNLCQVELYGPTSPAGGTKKIMAFADWSTACQRGVVKSFFDSTRSS